VSSRAFTESVVEQAAFAWKESLSRTFKKGIEISSAEPRAGLFFGRSD
jgi:hypothetical protein